MQTTNGTPKPDQPDPPFQDQNPTPDRHHKQDDDHSLADQPGLHEKADRCHRVLHVPPPIYLNSLIEVRDESSRRERQSPRLPGWHAITSLINREPSESQLSSKSKARRLVFCAFSGPNSMTSRRLITPSAPKSAVSAFRLSTADEAGFFVTKVNRHLPPIGSAAFSSIASGS